MFSQGHIWKSSFYTISVGPQDSFRMVLMWPLFSGLWIVDWSGGVGIRLVERCGYSTCREVWVFVLSGGWGIPRIFFFWHFFVIYIVLPVPLCIRFFPLSGFPKGTKNQVHFEHFRGRNPFNWFQVWKIGDRGSSKLPVDSSKLLYIFNYCP